MPSTKGSAAAAIQATPESAEWYRKQLVVAQRAARRSAAALAAACADLSKPPATLMRAADRAVEDASRLRGLASLLRHFS